jgi:hypothetical protein
MLVMSYFLLASSSLLAEDERRFDGAMMVRVPCGDGEMIALKEVVGEMRGNRKSFLNYDCLCRLTSVPCWPMANGARWPMEADGQ